MNATIHEIVQALAPTALVECMSDISGLSTPSRTLTEFRQACESALIANVGETEARQLTTEKRGCLTCAFADYLRTPTGKLKKGTYIKCRCPPPSGESIVAALRGIVPDSMLHQFSHPLARVMWPEDGDDGAECSQWKGSAE